jgi:hypothetical protein
MALFQQAAEGGLPLLVDVAIDLQTGLPVTAQDKPVLHTGLAALRQWVHFALAEESRRFAWAAHTADYGNELEALRGYPITEAESRLPEVIRQALEGNPYILAVNQVAVQRREGTLAAAFTLETVYGSMEYEGEVRIA